MKHHRIEELSEARKLLLEAVPDAEKRFNRYCKGLKKLLDDVNKHLPEAHYFACSGTMTISLWHPEVDTTWERNKAQALSYSSTLHVDGGDY